MIVTAAVSAVKHFLHLISRICLLEVFNFSITHNQKSFLRLKHIKRNDPVAQVKIDGKRMHPVSRSNIRTVRI